MSNELGSEASAGTTSDGGYHVLLELAQGGTANVVLAVQRGAQGVDKLVVLKVLKENLGDPDLRAMFVREARFSARLNHANIVQTSGIIEMPSGPAIVMEYLEGHSVAAILARARTRIPLEMHLRIIMEALRGLHYAHELTDLDGTPLNVVHRDVSPQNVFVTYDGQVKLIDFGIAKVVGSAETMTGVIKGKLRYMPSEQIEGSSVDRRTDVYAAGVMLWEAATRERMWKAESDVALMRRVLDGEVPRPRATNPDVPEALERIILKALSPYRGDRHATAAELEADLEAFLGDGTPVAMRDIGKFVAQLFAEVRTETKRVIAQQLSRAPTVTHPSTEPITVMKPLTPRTADPATSSLGASSPLSLAPSAPSPAKSRRTTYLVLGAVALPLAALSWRVLEPAPAAGHAAVEAAVETAAPPPSATPLAPPAPAEPPASVPAPSPPAPSVASHDRASGSEPRPNPQPPAEASHDGAAVAARPHVAAVEERKPPAPSVPSPVSKLSKEGCDPPYTIDSGGNKHFKMKCL